jgi:Skp family chaperone for outer membrane proteins
LSSEEKADKEELKEAIEQAFGPIVYKKGQGHGVIPDSVKQTVNEALSQAGLAPQQDEQQAPQEAAEGTQPATEGQEIIEAPQAPTEEEGGEAVAEQAPQEPQPEAQQAAVEQPQAQPQAPPPPPPPAQQPQAVVVHRPEAEGRLEAFRRMKQMVIEMLDAVKQLGQATPEQLELTRDLIEKVFGFEERKEAPSPPPQPIVVEKPVIKEVQVPQPVVPKEISEKVENVDSRMAALEQKLAKYDEILARIAEAMDRNSAMMDEITRLREELARTRQEYEQKLQSLQQQAMVIPKSRIVRPDGVVLEEYDFHPALKVQEKAAEYRYGVWGPALIEEVRATRSDISAGINRIASLIESVLTPELKRRAPQIAEDIQERFRRLVGGMLTPEEREKELAELEAKVAEAQKVVQQAAQQAAASAASEAAKAAEGAGKS